MEIRVDRDLGDVVGEEGVMRMEQGSRFFGRRGGVEEVVRRGDAVER